MFVLYVIDCSCQSVADVHIKSSSTQPGCIWGLTRKAFIKLSVGGIHLNYNHHSFKSSASCGAHKLTSCEYDIVIFCMSF